MSAAAAPTAATTRVALVSGANKGIGLAIVSALAKGDSKLTVLLGARDAKRGEEAKASLKLPNVQVLALNVDDEKSIAAAAAATKQQFGGLDILINNAGIAWKGDAFDETVARGTIHTNYYGVKNMQKHFLPLIRSGGRVVNISSVMGKRTLGNVTPAQRDAFMAADLTEAKLDALAEQFIADVKDGSYAAKGWPKTTYGMSKVLCSMLTRITARDFGKAAGSPSDVLINCCCPGWVKTDMAGPNAELTVEEGAVTPVFLALLPKGSQTGLFWQKKAVSDWFDAATATKAK